MYFSQLILNYPIHSYFFLLISWIILEIYYIYSTNLALKIVNEELATLKKQNAEKVKEFYSLLKQ